MFRHEVAILLIVLLITYLVDSMVTNIKQKIKVGRKTFTCTFKLSHTDFTVNLRQSSVGCTPKKPRVKAVNVELSSTLYTFVGRISLNPSKILSMEILPPPTTRSTEWTTESTTASNTTTTPMNQTAGPVEIEFKGQFLDKQKC